MVVLFKLAFDAILTLGQRKEKVVGREFNIFEKFRMKVRFNARTFSALFLLVNCKWDIVFVCSTLWPYNDSNSKHVKIDCERMHRFLVPLNKSCTYHSMYPPLPWHGIFSPSIRRRWLQHRWFHRWNRFSAFSVSSNCSHMPQMLTGWLLPPLMTVYFPLGQPSMVLLLFWLWSSHWCLVTSMHTNWLLCPSLGWTHRSSRSLSSHGIHIRWRIVRTQMPSMRMRLIPNYQICSTYTQNLGKHYPGYLGNYVQIMN